MTKARRTQISLQDTKYYHCISRCVRRSFLFGDDEYSNKNFDHRRTWIVNRIKQLTTVFAIDVAAYAVMSNHYHLVLHVNTDQQHAWSDDEVLNQWLKLYKPKNALVERYLSGEATDDASKLMIKILCDQYRERLGSISWFMSALNGFIARKSNKEDGCKGRFWEGRFRCQALLDEVSILACMAYVDLNPVRAGIASSLQNSDYTSIQERLGILPEKHKPIEPVDKCDLPYSVPLQNFRIGGQHQSTNKNHIPIDFITYATLVEATGKEIRKGKKGRLNKDIEPIVKQLGMTSNNWIELTQQLEQSFAYAIGELDRLEAFSANTGRSRVVGKSQSQRFFIKPAVVPD